MTSMKSNESDVTIERTPHQDELPELAVRLLSDFARIVAAEARLLESNIVGAAQICLDRASSRIHSDRAQSRRRGCSAGQPDAPAPPLDAMVAGAWNGRRLAAIVVAEVLRRRGSHRPHPSQRFRSLPQNYGVTTVVVVRRCTSPSSLVVV